MLEFIFIILGIYAIAMLLAEYDGPKKAISKLRSKLDINCSVCIAFWIALIFFLFFGVSIIQILAALGAVILLMRNL